MLALVTATPGTEFHIDTELNAMSGTNVDVLKSCTGDT